MLTFVSMEGVPQLSEFGKLFLYLIVGTLLVFFTLLLGKIIAPSKKNPLKHSTYECGETALGSSWIQFNNRFYVIALIFLLFDVEIVFIFPWATIFGRPELIAQDARWGYFTLLEMFTFVGILLLGLVYVWVKGDLEWTRPNRTVRTSPSPIPASAYERVNAAVYHVVPFHTDTIAHVEPASLPKPAIKAGFQPRFVKKGTPNT